MGLDRINQIRFRMSNLRTRFDRTGAMFQKEAFIKKKLGRPMGQTRPDFAFKPDLTEKRVNKKVPDLGGASLLPVKESFQKLLLDSQKKEIGQSSPLSGAGVLSPYIEEMAGRFGLDSKLLNAVVKVESGYNPDAVSSKGAMGLMQLMPGTAKQLGVKNPFDPVQNLEGGARLLSTLLGKYNQNLDFALSAYNAGEHRVKQYNGVPPFKETQNYIKKIKKELN